MSAIAPDFERIVRLQLVGGSYLVTIPKKAITQMSWMPGDHLHIARYGNRVEIEAASEHYVRLGIPRDGAREEVPEPEEGAI